VCASSAGVCFFAVLQEVLSRLVDSIVAAGRDHVVPAREARGEALGLLPALGDPALPRGVGVGIGLGRLGKGGLVELRGDEDVAVLARPGLLVVAFGAAEQDGVAQAVYDLAEAQRVQDAFGRADQQLALVGEESPPRRWGRSPC